MVGHATMSQSLAEPLESLSFAVLSLHLLWRTRGLTHPMHQEVLVWTPNFRGLSLYFSCENGISSERLIPAVTFNNSQTQLISTFFHFDA